MPAFYDYWAKWRTNDSVFWGDAAAASRAVLRLAPVAENGLIPAEIDANGEPAPDIDYHDEVSARTLLNRWFANSWMGPYSWVADQSGTLLSFFLQREEPLVSSYYLDGRVRGDRNTAAHIAMSAAAAATTGDLDTYGSFLQALVDEPIPSGDSRYYDGMLYLIAFLAVSGNVTAFGP
jgi:oligosaccharide reducing-end xylanase